jgi:hypothetical protein
MAHSSIPDGSRIALPAFLPDEHPWQHLPSPLSIALLLKQ